MEVQAGMPESANLIIIRGGKDWAYKLDVSYEYATEILCETPIVIKWMESTLTEVFAGTHPALGDLVVMICATGYCHLMCSEAPIKRRADFPEAENPLILHANNDAWFLKHIDRKWGRRYAIDADAALRLLAEGGWEAQADHTAFQVFDGDCQPFGRARLFLVTVGDCYLYTESGSAVCSFTQD